jgi:RHS repeat-associated protein
LQRLSETVGIATTNPQLATTSFVYDGVDRVIGVISAYGVTGLQRTNTIVYDLAGNIVNTIDGLGNKSTFTYDALNRAVSSIDPRGATTTVIYDASDNVLAVVDPVNNRTTFSYDVLSRVTQMTDPLNHNATYAYDAADRLTSATDRDGRRIDYTYDALDRITNEKWVSGGSTVNTLTFTYDSADNMLTALNNASAYTMAYDALDHMTSVQEPFALTLTYSYDAADNQTQRQDSFGGTLTSVYDPLNRLSTREFGGTSQTPLRIDVTYTAQDQIATETRYSDLAGSNKIGSTTYTYDALGEITNLQHRNGSGTLLANYTYTYDLGSRLTSETLNGTTTSYGYDTANELTSAGSNNYSFDLNGNRNMSGYTTGTGNQLTGDGVYTYAYDNEGNLTSKTKTATGERWTYGYDNANELTSVVDKSSAKVLLMQATYVYDAFGQRIEKDVWTSSTGTVVTRFGYENGNVWVDLNSSNQLQYRRFFLDGIDQVFARIDSSGNVAWYLPDRMGSIRDITDNTGTVQDHINYDGFGNVSSESNTSFGDRYKWTGREFDSETGLQYNRARYYNPGSGRWISQDPIGFVADDTNLYRYVGNDPTQAQDPAGLQATGGPGIPDYVPRYPLGLDRWGKRQPPRPTIWPPVQDYAYGYPPGKISPRFKPEDKNPTVQAGAIIFNQNGAFQSAPNEAPDPSNSGGGETAWVCPLYPGRRLYFGAGGRYLGGSGPDGKRPWWLAGKKFTELPLTPGMQLRFRGIGEDTGVYGGAFMGIVGPRTPRGPKEVVITVPPPAVRK